MKEIAIFFVDRNGINHFFQLDRGLHYQTFPGESQIFIDYVDDKGACFVRSATKLKYSDKMDIELLEKEDFFYRWSEDIPMLIDDCLFDNEEMDGKMEKDGKIRINLNIIEDIITETIQRDANKTLNRIKEQSKQTSE